MFTLNAVGVSHEHQPCGASIHRLRTSNEGMKVIVIEDSKGTNDSLKLSVFIGVFIYIARKRTFKRI